MMRPDTINWADKQSHVTLSLPPRRQAQRVTLQWIAALVTMQWVATIATVLLMLRHWRINDEFLPNVPTSMFGAGFPTAICVIATTLAAIATGCLGLLIFGMRIRRRNRGLEQLYQALSRIGKETEIQPVAVIGCAEIDFLLAAFNDMAGRLASDRRRLLELNQDLETRVRERTDQWRQASQLAEQANKAKSAFLATMSHEIRTPLTGVIASLQALKHTSLTPPQEKLSIAGWTSANALLNLINDILDLSAIDAGKIQLASRPFLIQAVAEEVLTIVGPTAAAKRLRLAAEIHPSASGGYLGDPARLRQVLLNLVNNAIKFTDHGSITISVEPATQSPGQTDKQLQFTVRDTGIGISEEGVRKLFERFSRTDNDDHALRGGTGLGLSISRELAQRMGGRIGVTSKPGKGSTFWFTAKLEPCTITDANNPTTASPSVRPTPPPTTGSTMHESQSTSSLSVLLAEDNPVNQFLIAEILTGLGATVYAANDGQVAATKAKTQCFDLILMDMCMPVLDGLSATRRIREHEQAHPDIPRTPIIGLTANVLQDDLDACKNAGMDGHMAKPVDLNQLKQLLDRIESVKSSRHPADTPDMQPPNNDTPIDLNQLGEACFGDQDRLKMLLDLIDQQFRSFDERLKDVTDQTDEQQLSQLAHSIVGCALQAEAKPLAHAARALEHADQDQRESTIRQVHQQLDECIEYLTNLQPSKPTTPHNQYQ